MSATKTEITLQGAGQDAWPALPHERNWGVLALFGNAAATGVATWVYIIGGFVSFYLAAGPGIFVILAGGLAGMLLIALALLPVTGRHGVDSATSTIPQLGTRGAYYSVFLMFVTMAGWNCLLLIFLGRAVAEIVIALGWFDASLRDTLVVSFSLMGAFLVWVMLWRGPSALRSAGPIISITVVALGMYILYLLVKHVGWNNLLQATPSEPSADRAWNFATGFEVLVVASIGWWPYVGGLVRLVPSAHKALWPTVVGLGLPLAVISIVGFFSGLAFPKSGGDPTVFLINLGGFWGGVTALLFIVLANIGTVLVGAYVSSIGLKRVPLVQHRCGWRTTTFLSLAPVFVIVALLPGLFFDHFGTFLAFVGVSFAPLCGVQIADYYFLRRQRGGVDVKAMFVTGPGTKYHFWGGVNPAGFLGIAAGFAAYLYLLNPLTYESHFPYQYVSASFPSAFVAGAVYLLMTKWVVFPAGRGGYSNTHGTQAVPQGTVGQNI